MIYMYLISVEIRLHDSDMEFRAKINAQGMDVGDLSISTCKHTLPLLETA